MNTPIPSAPTYRDPEELIEIWAANLELEDVTLAPFMPARLTSATPGAPRCEARTTRINQLIARAQGRRSGIIL